MVVHGGLWRFMWGFHHNVSGVINILLQFVKRVSSGGILEER